MDIIKKLLLVSFSFIYKIVENFLYIWYNIYENNN